MRLLLKTDASFFVRALYSHHVTVEGVIVLQFHVNLAALHKNAKMFLHFRRN